MSICRIYCSFRCVFMYLQIFCLGKIWDIILKHSVDALKLYPECTDSIKINRPDHNIRMYWTNFWQQSTHVQQNIYGKTLLEVCSPHLYASFCAFYAKIGQLFQPQWVFEICLKTDKSLLSKENVVDFRILPNI